MKRTYIIFSFIISLLILGSCREIKVDTIVNKDGSFKRVVTITGDSSDVFKSGLPYPIDDTWEKTFEKDSTDDKNFILTYSKLFEKSDVLNQEINKDTSWRRNLKRKIDIEKRFGFFYSYIVYKETIGAANPFTLLNYKDYLSNEDMLWLTGKKLAVNRPDSALIEQAEDKAEKYLQETLTSEIITILKNGIEELHDPEIKTNMVEKYKDSIRVKVDEWDYNSTSEFVDYFAKLINNNEIYKIKVANRVKFEKLDMDVEYLFKIFEMEDYSVSVELPGLITNTNSVSINGNKVQWSVGTMSFLLEDFIMISESRVVNKWMFVIGGIVLLLLIMFTIFKSRK